MPNIPTITSPSSLVKPNYITGFYKDNRTPVEYLGSRLFSREKQISNELNWIKGASGAPIALTPAAYDAEVALRGRIGADKISSEMPLFREGVQMTEKDRQDLNIAVKLGGEYVQDIMNRIYNDPAELIDAANVIPEIMIWSVVAPKDGKPKISITGDGVNYAYDYDPSGEWFKKNFFDFSAVPWSSRSSAMPLTNISDVVSAAAENGTELRYGVCSEGTFKELMASEQIRYAVYSPTSVPYVSRDLVREIVLDNTKITLLVYNAAYRSQDKKKHKFYPDGIVSFIPEGELGKRVYATTPEEFDLINDPSAPVSLVDDSIAVTVEVTSTTPKRYTTYVSEVVLPTYERMDEVYVAKIDAD